MKKTFYLVLVFMLGLVLVSCAKKPDDREVLRYAAWNLGTEAQNNIERRMIKAFEEANPNVRIDIIERPMTVDENGNEVATEWDAFFTAEAARGAMPDVFQVSSNVKAIEFSWISDVTEQVAADEDFNNMPVDIRESAKYNGKIYGLPQAMFYFGYFINRTVINEKSPTAVDIEYGITFDDLMSAAKKVAKAPVSGGDGIVGIDGVGSIYQWLPAQYDDSLGWFTHNADGYHLDSDAFRTAMQITQSYYGTSATNHRDYVLESTGVYFEQTQNDFWNPATRYGEGSAFENGQQAIKWEASYNLRNWLAATKDPNTTMPGLFGADIDFIGTPSVTVDGTNVHKIPVVIDYIGVGNGTKNKDLAYKFAKWMGFGKDGYTKRLEIATQNPEAGAVNFAPIVQDEELTNKYFELYPTLTEFKKIVTSHQGFIIESLGKTVPNYALSRWEGKYDEERNIAKVLDEIRDGKVNLSDVIVNLNNLINRYFEEGKTKLEGK
ncbi:ABC transporter substrate-binding protein [Haploplasma axanthum]|uniref:Maltose-binding periplasmic proteins/domains n=1 Tax=Haploplasma axanthum TaxID=29552 RepID=A0A449BG08_HAPAX|nr:ABC transporter substrate-binding protein [Haploplasma axanthum]VEU81220.1 Maltose-binding periplasmic proteins/domains [Haploplasma axanthum]